MLRHSKKHLAGRAMATLAMAAGLVGSLATGPAAAASAAEPPSTLGTNGQQVEVCVKGGHFDIRAFTINGTNQNNNYVASPKLLLPGDRTVTRCYALAGWYWKWTIDVDFWDDNDGKLGTRQCYVPLTAGTHTTQCWFN
ncbi:hypothetical protein KQY30_09925 [Streptomyces sp. GMY02]|uniref:hypothetical protein n=1 Tax=Streptomyces sp. GMY02 TaxID=1333528 RepID=UPI001C2B8903|nr:hypothetical protein [Streptomyces sp. GMY02]QXE34556.1 hypothetical protein KQY30_09925 [Streptomyces sp. GMY02]